MRYTKVPVSYSKEQFAAALNIDPALVIESPRATVDERIRDSYFFRVLADLFNERRASKYLEYEYRRRLSLDNFVGAKLNMEYLTVFKYIYKPFDTLIYVSVANGIARFDLLACTLEFQELTELPEVPKEPFGAEHIWYLLYQLPFRYSRKPSEWEYCEGEWSGYHFDDKSGFGDVPSTWRRPPCPAGTDFGGALSIVTFNLQCLNPIPIGLSEIKGSWYLQPGIRNIIDDLRFFRMKNTQFEVLGRKVIYGVIKYDCGIFIEYDGTLTQRFKGPDLPDEPILNNTTTIVVGDAPFEGENVLRAPEPATEQIERVVSALSAICTFTNQVRTVNADLVRAMQPRGMLRCLLNFPYNNRLRLFEDGKRRYMTVFDSPQKFKEGEIVFRNNIFCPANYEPQLIHQPTTVDKGKKSVAVYPAFECASFCVYMTRKPNSTEEEFFLFNSQTGALTLIEGYPIGFCEEIGAIVEKSKDLSDLLLK